MAASTTAATGATNRNGRSAAPARRPTISTRTARLRPDAPTEAAASTTYRYDPRDPVPTIGGNISAAEIVMPAGGYDQRGRPGLYGCTDTLPLNARHDILTFQTPPLEADTEVTGPISVHLWASSSAVDTDFTAKLIDVYPPNVGLPGRLRPEHRRHIIRARYRDDRATPTLMTPGRSTR